MCCLFDALGRVADNGRRSGVFVFLEPEVKRVLKV